MKKSLLIIIGIFIYAGLLAQNSNNVKIEKKDGKFHLKIEKELNGKKTIVDKTYNSLEEMKNDPDLTDFNFQFFNGDALHEMVFISDDDGSGDDEVKVLIELIGDTEFDIDKDFDHNFTFKNNGSDLHEVNNVKVWFDADGEKHVSRNGEEIELGGDSWTDENGNSFVIERADGKIMIMSDGATDEFFNSDGELIELHLDHDKPSDGEHRVMFFNSVEGESDGHKTISVKVIEHIRIHLEEVEENDFIKIADTTTPPLEMDELSYYPNPNNGRFTLQFKADNRPTEVKITSLDGKTVYSENLQGFEGSYQNEIDLSGQKRGIYLLQIIQGSRTSNKKIVIE